MTELTYIGCVKDGAVITFPNYVFYFMKVCGRNGVGGAVNLFNGRYYTYHELENCSLGTQCHVVSDDLDSIIEQD